jgi:hypothetical protein
MQQSGVERFLRLRVQGFRQLRKNSPYAGTLGEGRVSRVGSQLTHKVGMQQAERSGAKLSQASWQTEQRVVPRRLNMTGVAAENLVPAVAGQRDGNMLPAQLRNQ